MFKSSKAPSLHPDTDFTKNLRETSFYRYGHLRSFGLTGEITALAVDPILSLFAVGTSSGLVHVYGQPSFQFTLPVSTISSSSQGSSIKFLHFHPGHHRLIAIDETNTLHSFLLTNISEHSNPLTHPPLPMREATYTLWGTITAVEQPLPSYTHMFLTVKDGTTLVYDLSRRVLGNWKVGNCWGEYEERMVRSGIPGRHKTLGGPMATCLAMNPRDLNILLIGYEGGVVAYNIQKAEVEKTFEMSLPPGAPGGGTYQDADGSLWTERTPTVTCITWRPDGLVFVVGHSDGCMTFWAYTESDKPLMVRTITHEDVNVADAESLFSAGALDTQIRPKKEVMAEVSHENVDGMPVLVPTPAPPAAVDANREPIFKLSWAGFPDQAALKLLMAAVDGEPLTNATVEYAERGDTLLVILGGQSPGEKPGINILQFPAYTPPIAAARRGTTPMSPSQSMPAQDRYAYRDSLMPTGSSNYPTKTPPEDFVLLPRSSPYFGLAHDPVALIVTLTPDASLSKSDVPRAERGLDAWAFPPPRSNVIPPSPGRKTWAIPGEGEKLVAMTPAPAFGNSSPGTPRTPGWRLPWTSPSLQPSPAFSPTLRVPSPETPKSINFNFPTTSATEQRRLKKRRRCRLPSQIWSGNLSILGCELHSLPTPTFKRLISHAIENAGNEDEPRISLHGGLAVPDLQSHGAPDVKVVKMDNYRIMITWHPDCCVRFWDVSPHLLVLPSPLRFEYPGALPHLTIHVGEWLGDERLGHLPIGKAWRKDRSGVGIKSVYLAREALECTITFKSGEVLVTKFGEAKPGGEKDREEDREEEEQEGYFPKLREEKVEMASLKQDWVEEVTELGDLARWKVDGFKPVAMFTLKRGEVLQCAVSDIGFLAVAFASKSLAILDMRGPDVVLREGFDEDGVAVVKKKKKKGNVQNVLGEQADVGAMKWVVAGLGTDATPRPRLIVSYAKGMTKIYTLVNVLGEWMVEPKPPTFTNESLSNPLASFVIDTLTGNELTPSAEALQAAMKMQGSPESKEKNQPPHCIWFAASRKSIRAALNFNGERVAKVEFDDEELAEVFHITRHGQKVLVAITAKGTALFYSMPFLEFITRMDLFYGHQSRRIGKLSMDDRSGDFIEHSGPLDINLRTFFHFRKPYPPRIDPCSLKRAVPLQPVPLNATTMVGSWIWGGAPITGAQLDAIVAGPSRPPLPTAPPPPKKPLISWGAPPEEPKPKPVAPAALPKRTNVAKTAAPIRDAREREDVYSQMRSAAEERGNYLDDLGEGIQNASISAGEYLSQARNSAMKEAAKSTAKGLFGKLL